MMPENGNLSQDDTKHYNKLSGDIKTFNILLTTLTNRQPMDQAALDSFFQNLDHFQVTYEDLSGWFNAIKSELNDSVSDPISEWIVELGDAKTHWKSEADKIRQSLPN